jgi:hypothetical protein
MVSRIPRRGIHKKPKFIDMPALAILVEYPAMASLRLLILPRTRPDGKEDQAHLRGNVFGRTALCRFPIIPASLLTHRSIAFGNLGRVNPFIASLGEWGVGTCGISKKV